MRHCHFLKSTCDTPPPPLKGPWFPFHEGCSSSDASYKVIRFDLLPGIRPTVIRLISHVEMMELIKCGVVLEDRLVSHGYQDYSAGGIIDTENIDSFC